jgi:hypothetical protein
MTIDILLLGGILTVAGALAIANEGPARGYDWIDYYREYGKLAAPWVSGYFAFKFLSANRPSGLGDLTQGEADAIQSTVDQAGRPLEVVGSAAKGSRGPGSDIDYVVPPGSLPHYEGLEGQLPGIDPAHGIIPGAHNPHMGPAIRFEPNTPPQVIPEARS